VGCALFNGLSKLNFQNFPKIDHQFIRLKENIHLKKQKNNRVIFKKDIDEVLGTKFVHFKKIDQNHKK